MVEGSETRAEAIAHGVAAALAAVLLSMFVMQMYAAWKRVQVKRLIDKGTQTGKRFRSPAAWAPVGYQQRIFYKFGLLFALLLCIRAPDPLARLFYSARWMRLLTFNTTALSVMAALISLEVHLHLWIIMKRRDVAKLARKLFKGIAVGTVLVTNGCFAVFMGLPDDLSYIGFVAFLICLMVIELVMFLIWVFVVWYVRTAVIETLASGASRPKGANQLHNLAHSEDRSAEDTTPSHSHMWTDDSGSHQPVKRGPTLSSVPPSAGSVGNGSSAPPQGHAEPSASVDNRPSETQVPSLPAHQPSTASLAEASPDTAIQMHLLNTNLRGPSASVIALTGLPTPEPANPPSRPSVGPVRSGSELNVKRSKTLTKQRSFRSTDRALAKLYRFTVIAALLLVAAYAYQVYAISIAKSSQKEDSDGSFDYSLQFPADMFAMYIHLAIGYVALWFAWQRFDSALLCQPASVLVASITVAEREHRPSLASGPGSGSRDRPALSHKSVQLVEPQAVPENAQE